MTKNISLSFAFILTFISIYGQHSKKVLFLGNSYTYVNDLPKMVADVANSVGDTVFYDSNCLGGYTLQNHTTDANSIAKIMAGNWDIVVVQEQSQLPSFPISQVQTEVFPYARKLDSLINVYNPCAETVFYMTWGRKNGDASNCASWPPVCTYQGMDSLLRLRYTMMANDNQAIISPVGPVFHYIRDHFPSIELYQADESHPTIQGTYAAACSFYCSLFRKDPTQISFQSTLSALESSQIIQAAKAVAFDSLSNWNVGLFDPNAQFSYVGSGLNIQFNNLSTYYSNCVWDFGIGDTTTVTHPVHTFAGMGNYSVLLKVYKCGQMDSIRLNIQVFPESIQNIKENPWLALVPNPAKTSVQITINKPISGNTKLIISDVIGRKISEKDVHNGQNTIAFDLTSFKNGLYFVTLTSSKGVVSFEKLMIDK